MEWKVKEWDKNTLQLFISMPGHHIQIKFYCFYGKWTT